MRLKLILVVLALAALAIPVTADKAEIRGPVATVEETSYAWGPLDFAGFFYDIDDNIGTEEIIMTITRGNVLDEDTGVIYTTRTQAKNFDFQDWGQFEVIGFLADEYFAGYVRGWYLARQSSDINLLRDEYLSKILMDEDDERTIATGSSLKLHENYELEIQAIDYEMGSVYFQLMKNGTVVDSAIVEPSKPGATIADKTYVYKKDIGDTKDIVIIAVNFKNAFRGAKVDLATIDGIWQISDQYTEVTKDTKYGRMTVDEVIDNRITMINDRERITLTRDRDIHLMEDIWIRTSDSLDPTRFYIYKQITEPGTYEVRATVSEVADGAAVSWDATNFVGFFYDIDDNIGTEEITMTITRGNVLDEDTGIVYTTTTQDHIIHFYDWGQFLTIGFLGDEYFAGYVPGGYLARQSSDINLMRDGQLSKVLINDDRERMIATEAPIKLAGGYELAIKGIDDFRSVWLELALNGDVVDSAIVEPSKPGATIADKTYVYKKDIGDTKDIVIIAVNFKNAFRGSGVDLATVSGIWQISDQYTEVTKDTKYGRMTVDEATDYRIWMINDGERITLSRDRDIHLMGDFWIRTSDSLDPTRFYIYKPIRI